jgi:predicted AAA+ superfamily ATPase
VIKRERHLRALTGLIAGNRVTAILGARQVGKTTLARQLVARRSGPTKYFDLEDAADRARLDDPMLALRGLRGLVVIDEVQRRPEMFAPLRVLADRPGGARFLVLGSAAPELLRQASETLAGRIAFYELGGLALDEVDARRAGRLWLRGGFPRSLVARNDVASAQWRRDFVRTFVERDVAQLSLGVPGATLERFWAMIAHYHGQVWNASELSRAFGVAHTTVSRYLDLLSATFVVRRLSPWHENLSKRQVKAPKVYVTDSGILHTLLGINDFEDLERHPKVGASWEGFALAQVLERTGARNREVYFWATHGGAELDLLLVRGRHRLGFEFKRTDAPQVTPSMRSALADLRLDRIDVIYPGQETFSMAERIRAVGVSRLWQDVVRLP